MLYNKNDIFIGGALQRYGEFSAAELFLFEQLIGAEDVVVEAGANIGAHTVQLSRMAETVYAFEPQRIVFQTLCANLALNQRDNVYARQAALGAAAGALVVPELSPSRRASFGSLSLGDCTVGESVPMVTLDSLGLPACRFIKVDVEGMESAVLRGAAATISRCRPLIYVENDREDASRELIELIDGFGYVAYWHFPPLFNPRNFAGDAENIFPGVVSINMLCAPQGYELRGMRKVGSGAERWRDAYNAG